MIRDVSYAGNLGQPYRWHSVSSLGPQQQPENHLGECRALMRLISKAIDAQCRQICDRKNTLAEIRKLVSVYVALNSYAREAEMEQIRIRMDEEDTSISPRFVSVPSYEDELIRNK